MWIEGALCGRGNRTGVVQGRLDCDLHGCQCGYFGDPRRACTCAPGAIGREIIRQLRTVLWTAAPDVRWIAEHIFGEGDWVAVRWTMRGTHTGDFVHPTWGSAPASGKPVALTYLDHYRIADGQIAETWEVRDGLSLQDQFGLVAAPRRPAS